MRLHVYKGNPTGTHHWIAAIFDPSDGNAYRTAYLTWERALAIGLYELATWDIDVDYGSVGWGNGRSHQDEQ